MPSAAEVKALAFDPVDRWAAVPDAVIARLVTVVTRFYADLAAEAECDDLIAYHVAHMLALAGVGLAAFIWSLKSGQYDDLEGAAWRILQDDDTPKP